MLFGGRGQLTGLSIALAVLTSEKDGLHGKAKNEWNDSDNVSKDQDNYNNRVCSLMWPDNETKGGICIKIEFNPQRNISLLQHGRRFFVYSSNMATVTSSEHTL